MATTYHFWYSQSLEDIYDRMRSEKEIDEYTPTVCTCLITKDGKQVELRYTGCHPGLTDFYIKHTPDCVYLGEGIIHTVDGILQH